ncbi:MAG: hypothetical protein K0S29_74 [Gammaproteobacteria bacterium]|jgi:hypothetical protein|nr:hypothetical protein [Gammaproteobacteria bacterium]
MFNSSSVAEEKDVYQKLADGPQAKPIKIRSSCCFLDCDVEESPEDALARETSVNTSRNSSVSSLGSLAEELDAEPQPRPLRSAAEAKIGEAASEKHKRKRLSQGRGAQIDSHRKAVIAQVNKGRATPTGTTPVKDRTITIDAPPTAEKSMWRTQRLNYGEEPSIAKGAGL